MFVFDAPPFDPNSTTNLAHAAGRVSGKEIPLLEGESSLTLPARRPPHAHALA